MQWLHITLITSCHPSRQRRFTAFFPDAVAPHHSDHFLPSIAPETVHQGDAAHLDQFDQSLLATRRPKTYVSFHKEEGEEKKEGE
eukprot:s1385_g44.t1